MLTNFDDVSGHVVGVPRVWTVFDPVFRTIFEKWDFRATRLFT